MAKPGQSERSLALRRGWLGAGVGSCIVVLGIGLAWPVETALQASTPREALSAFTYFITELLRDSRAVLDVYVRWFNAEVASQGRPPISWIVPSAIGIFIGVFIGGMTNPYSFERDDFGSARFMKKDEAKREKLFAPTGIILGRWGNSWKFVRNEETLSALVIAPPGTAKTVQLIANILADWPDTQWPRLRQVAGIRTIVGMFAAIGGVLDKASAVVSNKADDGLSPGPHERIFAIIMLPITICTALIALPFKAINLLLSIRVPGDARADVPGPSMIINDPKGEICKITSGWRSQLGPVFRISWGDAANSARWNPLSPWSYPGGEQYVAHRSHVIEQLSTWFVEPDRALPGLLRAARDGRQGSWVQDNAIGDVSLGSSQLESIAGRLHDDVVFETVVEGLIKLDGDILKLRSLNSDREKHLERLAAILIPESIEAHWRNTGREFLLGAMGFIMARSERLELEPTFGLLLDELNTTSKHGTGFSDPTEVRDENGEDFMSIPGLGSPEDPSGGDGDDDQIARVLNAWIQESLEFGYPERFINDLQATVNKPDRERGSVISTAGSSINMFKNGEVRAVTSTSDFRLETVRQIDGKPVTYYLVVSLEDANYLGRLTGLFMETHAAFAISQDADEVKKTSRPLIFMADEFWTMPPLESLMQIPALGRGQWVQLIVIGQSFGQIATKFLKTGGQEVVKTLKSAMSYIVIFTQNDFSTAKEISDSIGKTTKLQKSVGRQGFSMSILTSQGDRGRTINESYQGRPLMEPDQIMSMEKLEPKKKRWGWHLVQTTGRMNRPMQLRPVPYWRHPVLKRRIGLAQKTWPNDKAYDRTHEKTHGRTEGRSAEIDGRRPIGPRQVVS